MDRQVRKNLDRISNLSENITYTILARLPILDAVRTSILSRNWRYKWTTFPNLVFVSKAVDDDKFVKSSKGIREFILKFNTGNWSPYKIHSSFFSCVSLWQLSLRGCKLPSPPPAFNGFNDLTCLRLSNVSVDNEGFENLIGKCLNLNSLHLTEVDGLDRLKIGYAPKLLTLVFVGSLKSIYINNTSNLSGPIISFSQLPNMNQNIGNLTSNSFINNLYGLSNIKSFRPGSFFLKFLGDGNVKKLLPSTFGNLFHLRFSDLMFGDIDSLSSVIGLITSSPNLTKLVVVTACMSTSSAAEERLKTVAKYLEGKSRSIECLMKLTKVEMRDPVGVGPEIELIKLIVGKSPSLKQMKIIPKETVHGFRQREPKILKDLLRFPRASNIAEIIYMGQEILYS
ncbi:hypothetical protein DITRI_Ditri12bG0018000 [Diplodiscus trichospermus]